MFPFQGRWEGPTALLRMCRLFLYHSVLPGCLRAPDIWQGTDRQTDRQKDVLTGGRYGNLEEGLHISQCKHTPVHATTCKYYLAKDYWVLLSCR